MSGNNRPSEAQISGALFAVVLLLAKSFVKSPLNSKISVHTSSKIKFMQKDRNLFILSLLSRSEMTVVLVRKYQFSSCTLKILYYKHDWKESRVQHKVSLLILFAAYHSERMKSWRASLTSFITLVLSRSELFNFYKFCFL